MNQENQNEKTLKILKWVIAGVLGFALLVLTFGAGIWIGEKRAQFSFRWAEAYHRNFGGPPEGFLGSFPQGDFTAGHGIFGTIIKIDGDTLIIKGQDNVEKTVVVSDKTTITDRTSVIKLQNLKVDDNVVVIGSPDQQGEIQARLIRILPPPPESNKPSAIPANNNEIKI